MADKKFNPLKYGCPRKADCDANGFCVSAQELTNKEVGWGDVDTLTLEQLERELSDLNSSWPTQVCGSPDLTTATHNLTGRIRIVEETIQDKSTDNNLRNLLDDVDINF